MSREKLLRIYKSTAVEGLMIFRPRRTATEWSSCSSMQIHSSIPSFGGVSVEWVFSCCTITIVCSFVRLDLGFFSSSFLTTIQPSTTCSRLHDPYLSEILPNYSRLTALDWDMIWPDMLWCVLTSQRPTFLRYYELMRFERLLTWTFERDRIRETEV